MSDPDGRSWSDPASRYNRRCLRDLQRKYPDMTMTEMLDRRRSSLATLRTALREGGEAVPDDDEQLMRWLKQRRLL